MGLKQYLVNILMFVSLISKEAEPLSVCIISALPASSFVNILYFPVGLFAFFFLKNRLAPTHFYIIVTCYIVLHNIYLYHIKIVYQEYNVYCIYNM